MAGVGNYGNSDVRFPAGGTWTGVIFGDVASAGGTNGRIPWRVATEQFAKFGSLSPAVVSLHPGDSRTVTVSAATPSSPGDGAGSYYEFHVARGVRNITANVSLANDAADPVGVYLISPDGDTLGDGQNSLNGKPTLSLTAYTLNPVPGNWTLIIAFAEPVVGNEISQPYRGSIQFNKVSMAASGLPDSFAAKLKAGTPVTVPVKITNHGVTAEDFFVDPRLNSTTTLKLVTQFGTSDTRDNAAAGGHPADLPGADPHLDGLGGRHREPADHVRFQF